MNTFHVELRPFGDLAPTRIRAVLGFLLALAVSAADARARRRL